jgi:chemotaxis protein methyltransferase CheR
MSASVFDALRRLAYDQAGIALRPNKRALVSARIAKRMRACGITSEREYLELLRDDQSGEEMVCFLDAISTNFTSFYREASHFELLQNEVERWVGEGARQLRIWCAAAATGEEPYSLAMTLDQAVGTSGASWRLLASDISVTALRAAQAGVYPESRLTNVPRPERLKYFRHHERRAAGEPRFVASDELKRRILFRRINLALPPFQMRGGLDAVFCRNVMIYFDQAVRARLIAEIERLLRPGGLLVIAHSETLSGIRTGLRCVMPSVYRKPEGS